MRTLDAFYRAAAIKMFRPANPATTLAAFLWTKRFPESKLARAWKN
jgi:hypothetical protein